MSEEIDSTTTTHSEGDQASLDIFGASESHSRLGNGAFNHVINSINPQKRKFSGDYENDESCDESKKQRANGNSDNNAIASASDSASSHIQAADNVCRNGNEATSDCPGEPCAKMLIKEEIKEEPLDDNEAQSTSSSELCAVKIEVKEEATVKQEDTTTEEATSSIRDSCQYGIKCYREEDTTSPTPSKKQWTSKDIEIMLKMVKERPVIWQVDYSDRTSRPNAFLEIEKVLGFPALEIKRKLHNMRCTFRNQYKTAQFQNKPVKWKFYEAMKFMYCSALNESADHWDDDVPTKSSEYHKVVVPWKKRIRESHSNHSKHSEPKTTDPAASSNSSVEEDQTACNQFSRDDSGMFGVYVADSIRNLPEDLKELAKRQITHLLFDITAHTDARQCNSSVENGDSFSVMDATTNVLYTVTDPVYGNYPQTVLNETREIQKNPAHRTEVAHPGDSDYRRPSYPDPPLGTPDCPYGDRCYRRNPVHFQQFAHPPSTDFEKNYRERKRILRQRAKNKTKKDEDEYEDDFIDDDESEDADFSTDEDEEYVPSDSDYDEL